MSENKEPKTITINLYGKRYRVPDNMTMLKALEYCGYAPTRGIGCRHGFCGACAMVYRIKGERQLHYCLGCETRVQDMMYISTISYFPLEKQSYKLDEIEPSANMIMHLYPEIYSCVSCNTCTATCTQGIDVMGYIHDAQRGDFKACAEKSFNCIMCNCCASRCPAGISHPEVAMLARRINGRYISPKSEHLEKRVEEVKHGNLCEEVHALIEKSEAELRELYNNREIEK
ncbi:MAG: 4Fe-4S ferredoxin [Clostridia bacterium]|nr:4Fe-4S ferredoxin [Clostridia bacterium]MBQ1895338.1 4Fe-4S ferredoxin [Clostridia bacterium]MBQ2092888.1 4Fe-4S ferredoxin [Clostridia bacterium]MBQ3897372.1 4Fe-4S ferredoxin [Clostridia bacterium]